MGQTVVYPGEIDSFNRAVNNWDTTLTTGIVAGDLSIDLDDNCAILPDTGLITIDEEVIYYSVKTMGMGGAATLTIPAGGRGFDSTVATSHGAGTTVQRLVVASDINHLEEALEKTEYQAGQYISISLTPGAMISPAAVDTLFTLYNGTGSDPIDRSMVIDFNITREITGTDDIYAVGVIRAVRYTADADNPQIGDLTIEIDGWQGGLSGTSVGITFTMSDNGADGTTLMYQTSNIANTAAITFQGRVYKFPG